jgi:hypothetical protein
MPDPHRAVVSAVVEGDVDEAVLRRLIESAGAVAGPVYGKMGKDHVRRQIRGYNHAARLAPWLVLVDLDREADCAPTLRRAWLPDPAPQLCFRVAVRAVEAWLLSDRNNLGRFLGIAVARIPLQPEMEPDPKRTMVALAAGSRRREIRLDMAPRPASGRQVGPAYSSRLIEFVESSWNPEAAIERSDSLQRCYSRLCELVGAGG